MPKKIIFVSRLDADCSLGAYTLCRIAARLAQKYPNIDITIVGGGSEYLKIADSVYKINKNINRELIKMVGWVNVPAEFYKKSGKNALFVGVSRAALEAMGHGLPAVLLGNEGFLGLFDENKLALARKTNFTARGIHFEEHTSPAQVLENALFSEIIRYFELSDSEKSRISELSRATVAKYYSADSMAKRTLSLYRAVLGDKYSK